MRVVVFCPTRGQPRAAAEMLATFRATVRLPSTVMTLFVDRDDPRLPEYLALSLHGAGLVVLRPRESGSLTRKSNSAASRLWGEDCILGGVSNDMRFETPGWDELVAEALQHPGVVYGDDGHFGQRLGTCAFVSSVIPRTLGWVALPSTRHYGVDDAWMDIGRGIGSLHYLPDLRITQETPREKRARHRTDGDPAYWEAQVTRKADGDAYRAWRDGGGREADVARLRALTCWGLTRGNDQSIRLSSLPSSSG